MKWGWCAVAIMAAWAWSAAAYQPDSLARAQEAFARQDWPAAEREARRAIAQNRENAGAHKLLGMVYAAQQRFTEAAEPLEQACRMAPTDPLSCYYLGRNEFALGRYEQSRVVLERALKRFPRSDRIRTGLGLTLEALGETAEAERQLREASRAGAEAALSELGQFLFRQGRIAESIEVLKKSGNREALERSMRELKNAPAGGARIAAVPVRLSPTELPMLVRNGAEGQKHQVETMIAGVAVFDYDGDGWPDIFVANGAKIPSLVKADASYSNRLFRNRHDGTFEDVTEVAGLGGRGFSMGAAAADFDNDGRCDLFVSGVRSNTLYRNRGNGTFEDVTTRAGVAGGGLWSVAAGWFDYDNDGRLDLFVVRYVVWDPATEPRCGPEKPPARSYCHPRFYAALPNALYHNEGDGRFRDVSAESGIAVHSGKGMGVAFADYDHDGLTDVFVTNDTVPNFLFRNLGKGRFEETALRAGVAFNGDGRATSAMGVDFRDYDNDGFEDLFITNLSNECYTLFRNTGKGEFADAGQFAKVAAASLRSAGWSALMADLNNDGWKDLFAAGGHVDDNVELTSSLESRQPNLLFVNRGDGTFESSALPGKAFHRGAAFGDFNRDGLLDVVVTRLGQSPLVLMNVTEPRQEWLTIRLKGRKSNRDGIGARIGVQTGAGWQWNHVSTSVGYGSSSEPVAHFGLGAAKAVRVEVVWPSGVRQVVEKPGANRLLMLEEPEE